MTGTEIIRTLCLVLTLIVFGFVIYLNWLNYKNSREDFKINLEWAISIGVLIIGVIILIFL